MSCHGRPRTRGTTRLGRCAGHVVVITVRELKHHVDFCVVGGGLAGTCAAIAAARHDASVVLMQDRLVLCGNAPSKIRMHVGTVFR
ncbi:MAG: FAD-dependent oxidoreductase [Anaerolineae bacterium]